MAVAHRPAPDVGEAFAAETRRIMVRRLPLGIVFFVGLVTVAGLIELVNYPTRVRGLAVSFGAEMALCAIALLASARPFLRRGIVLIAVTLSLGIVAAVTLYVVWAGASGDALAFTLIIFLAGVALLYPWGLLGQAPVVLGTVAAYVFALAAGVRGELPRAYGLLAVGGGAITSLFGAGFLDVLRGSIFHQRLLLERARDRQMATLYDVTRTVTATLDLQQVLRLVCQGVLQALGLERLWLFWREAPDGDVRALEARLDAGEVQLTELTDDPGAWRAVLEAPRIPGPTLVEPGPAELAALNGRGAPPRLLRVPLEFRSELVGVILAEKAGSDAPEASFLDAVATLGNSAAMAIGNARLYALVGQHRAELQRLSNKGLVVIEEVMRRISRELHDGTCQALMAIKLDLGLLERQLGAEAAGIRRAVQDIRTQVVDVMHGVRQMSHLIHPPVLDDFGAVAAIESVAAKYRGATGLDVRVECPDPAMRFGAAVELLLFRVFQEAIANVLKHAGATRVVVRLGMEQDVVHLQIEDDGCGFDAHTYLRRPPPSAGLGLIGMRERVSHLGGTFRVTSRQGRGTRVDVTVPAEPIQTAKLATA
jgi:signal transduction histidine kinase